VQRAVPQHRVDVRAVVRRDLERARPAAEAHVELAGAVDEGRGNMVTLYSSCGMPGSGQAMTCTEDDTPSHTARTAPQGSAARPRILYSLQCVRVHKGKAGER